MSKWIDEVSLPGVKSSMAVAHAGEAEFAQAKESDTGGRSVRLRLVRPPEEQTSAHPFSKFTRRRRGKGGSIFTVSFVEINGVREFMVDLLLLNWTSNPRGDFVDFLVEADTDKHPFMGCTRPSANTPGTRWMIVAVERDTDEQIVKQEREERHEEQRKGRRPQHLSNVAQIIVKNPQFWEWVNEISGCKCQNTKEADTYLKEFCGIESKSELDSVGPEGIRPIARFHRLREKFAEWCDRMGYEHE